MKFLKKDINTHREVLGTTAVTRNGEKCGKFTFIFRKKFYLSRKIPVPKFATSCSRETLCDIISKKLKTNNMKIKITIILMLFISFFANSQEVKYINASELNIRSGAGKNYAVVTKAGKNEKVTIISKQGNWTEIETENGEKGYVASEYLSTTITNQKDATIGDYPVVSIIVGCLLIFLIFRIKKFLENLFKFSPSKNRVTKKTCKEVISKPKQKVENGKNKNIQKEVIKKDIVLCKNCGSEYGSITSLTTNNCKNTNGKHQLYEGTIKSQYVCKHCGSKYNSIFQMTINNCKKSPTGKHQPAV
jgi:uncharacterized protein YgiM (DUF1202 family)